MLDLIYLLVLLFAAIFVFFRFSSLSGGLAMIGGLLVFAFLNEAAAYWVARRWGSNYWIYNAGMIVDYVLTLLYFRSVFPKSTIASRLLVPAFAAAGIAFGIINMLIWQPFMSTLNTNFIFLSNIIVSMACLYALFTHFASVRRTDARYRIYFWTTILLLINSAAPLAIWMSYQYFDNYGTGYVTLLDDLLVLINIITVAGISLLLLFHINGLRHG